MAYRHRDFSCCIASPDYYYQTRSFELIKRMEIIGKDIYVIYDGISRTKDEDFD